MKPRAKTNPRPLSRFGAIFAIGAMCVMPPGAGAEPAAPEFRMNAPHVETSEEGAVVRGAVCRRAWVGRRPELVRVERVGAEGGVRESAMARLRGAPSYRGGCGFYTARLRRLGEGESMRVTALANR